MVDNGGGWRREGGNGKKKGVGGIKRMKRITGARRIEGRRGERKKEETKEEDQIPLNTCSIVLLRSFPNLQTPEDLGKPGLSYITSHTHTCTQSVICPTTTSLPAPVFLFFLPPFLPVFSRLFFQR